jgi:periplasmic protein CpxP/Spy
MTMATSLNAVENMQSYANIAQRHAQDVQRLVPAFQNLYNSLSDEQRRTADQVFRSYPGDTQRHRKG